GTRKHPVMRGVLPADIQKRQPAGGPGRQRRKLSRRRREPARAEQPRRSQVRSVKIVVGAEAEELHRAVAASGDRKRLEGAGRHVEQAKAHGARRIEARRVNLVIVADAEQSGIAGRAVLTYGDVLELTRGDEEPAGLEVALGVKARRIDLMTAGRRAETEDDG